MVTSAELSLAQLSPSLCGFIVLLALKYIFRRCQSVWKEFLKVLRGLVDSRKGGDSAPNVGYMVKSSWTNE